MSASGKGYTCSECGASNPEGGRFCGACHAPLPAAAATQKLPEAETPESPPAGITEPASSEESSQVPKRHDMSYGKAFGFFFEDKDWVRKILMGALFNLLGVVLIGTVINTGYFVRVMRRVRDGLENPLPEWDDIGGLLTEGLAPWGIALLYSLPAILPGVAANVLSTLGEAVKDDAGGVFAMFACCCSCSSILGYLLLAMMPAALIQYVRTGEFGAAFRFGEMFKLIRKCSSPYVLTLLVALGAHMLGGFGVILCCVGVLASYFWSGCVAFHLYGQLWRFVEEAP
ncbi:MAG: DUF4013 domain-containing protein [Armatimonadetes bacterium]|nr:DUF4013 domain-containing protein [Armatimonadota bacterium]